LGTAGGLVKFKNELLRPVGAPREIPQAVFVINSDICGDLPVEEMVKELERKPQAQCLLLTTEATREQSKNFGCVAVNADGEVMHYVDKPSIFLSTHISCGLYLMRPSIWSEQLEPAAVNANGSGQLWFESSIFPQMASAGKLYAFHTTRWWSQTKTPGAALYANRHYLRLYRESNPERLCTTRAQILGDVFIDPTAIVSETAKIGPNVSIGAGAVIGAGVRIRESIILPECVIEDHCCVLYSVIGLRCVLGELFVIEKLLKVNFRCLVSRRGNTGCAES
jgi:mannose-1-phosphate guanylyltransferase